jgi:hypothetical protein
VRAQESAAERIAQAREDAQADATLIRWLRLGGASPGSSRWRLTAARREVWAMVSARTKDGVLTLEVGPAPMYICSSAHLLICSSAHLPRAFSPVFRAV